MPSGAFNYNFAGGQSVVSPSVNSTYTVNGTGLLGCVANSAISTVTVVQRPQLMASTSRNTMCLGETAQLIAIGADSYMWSGGITSPTINISPIQTTFYSVVGTNIQGCTSTVAVMQHVAVCASLKDMEEQLNSTLLIYPNPNDGTFEIKSNES